MNRKDATQHDLDSDIPIHATRSGRPRPRGRERRRDRLDVTTMALVNTDNTPDPHEDDVHRLVPAEPVQDGFVRAEPWNPTDQPDAWDTLRREIDRSRRYRHPVTLIRVQPPAPAAPSPRPRREVRVRRGADPLLDVVEAMRRTLRSGDAAWSERGELFVVLAETDGPAAGALVSRLRSCADGVLAEASIQLASFPEDGLTIGALRAVIARRRATAAAAERSTTPRAGMSFAPEPATAMSGPMGSVGGPIGASSAIGASSDFEPRDRRRLHRFRRAASRLSEVEWRMFAGTGAGAPDTGQPDADRSGE